MKAGELKDLLENVDDEAEVFFFLEQQYGSRRYKISGASAFSTGDGDCTEPEEADEAYLFGTDAGYAPLAATNEQL